MAYVLLIFCAIFSLSCAIMAKHKNRNPLLWAGLGVVGGIVSYFVIAAMPSLCAYCQHPFNKSSDGVHCNHCGKANKFNNTELNRINELTSILASKGEKVKHTGVNIVITQKNGAKLNFVGLERLEDYAKTL